MELSQTPWYESYPKDVPHTVNEKLYENLNIMFDEVCKIFADKEAFFSFGSSITYKELQQKTLALAAFMQKKLGINSNDRVAIILPNLIQYPISVFAALHCGAQVVNINPLYTPHEMLGVLRDCKASTVITLETNTARLLKIDDQNYVKHIISCSVGDCLSPIKGFVTNFVLRHVKKAVPKFDKTNVLFFNECIKEGSKLQLDKVEIKFDDIGFLQYTGGTTGKPKGAMLSHGNIISNIAQAWGMYGSKLHRGEEFILTALPLYHIFAMTINLMFALYLGTTNLLIADPRRFNSLIKELQRHSDVSIITGVNTLFNAFVNFNVFEKVNLKHLRLVVAGGTAVQSGVAQRFLKASGIPILEGYGLTECSPLCCVNPYTSEGYNGTIGIPTPSTLARIVDTTTNEVILDTERSGELEFKGPQVMKGYFNNEVETKNVFDDGWLRTGDIAKWCKGGYIKIIDRIKDMIIVSGFNVFPSEIEDVVSHNDKVLECAVIGIPSNTSGESIKLFVVRKDMTLTKAEIEEYCRKFLTGYKIPRHIEFVDALPKSPVGKVMRRYLKQNRLN